MTFHLNIKEPLAPSDYGSFCKNDAYLFAAFLTVASRSGYVIGLYDNLCKINK